MRSVLLKAAATALTIGTTVASASYVTGHLKNPAAPLQPAVLTAKGGAGGPSSGAGLVAAPSVQPTDAAPVASTYAS